MTIPTPRERAQLGSLSRVAACLINERAVESTFADKTITIRHANSKDEEIRFQLRQVPLRTGYVYPKDFTSAVSHTHGEAIADGADLMQLYGRWAGINVDRVYAEFKNCVDNQELAYQKPTDHLSIDSPIIDWEQAIIEGHSIHPWHKCRFPLVSDFTTATIHFVLLDRDSEGITVAGDYNHWIQKALTPELKTPLKPTQIIIPVHSLQLPNIKSHFPTAEILPHTLQGHPQSSLRTINLPTTTEICIKIPVPLKITSIVRTIRPWAITVGHRMSPILTLLEQAASSFGGSLITLREHSAAASPSDHLGCIIRESTESVAARTNSRIIVCAALTENITAIWDPATLSHEERCSILREYCVSLFRALLPSVLLHGFALQAHLQNLLIRLDPVSKKILGFVARDFGSFRVHAETFRATAGVDINTDWVLTSMDSLEKVYGYILSVVHGHVTRMTRALEVGNEGWRIAREELEGIIPEGNELARRVWLESETRVARAHISMQLYGVKSECRNIEAPNLFWYATQ
ncbi:IucC family-domain-containing protein [Aspergillus karnatakaensis]|uniref:IucC family-domain-containing protein n=1 Tax=Aspergillus karnatakaensis TaxID=1810916 RepID=UPI003CCCA8A5